MGASQLKGLLFFTFYFNSLAIITGLANHGNDDYEDADDNVMMTRSNDDDVAVNKKQNNSDAQEMFKILVITYRNKI